MTVDYDSYLRKQKNQLAQYSAQLMSDSKWLKVFRLLTKHRQLIKRCVLQTIFDDVSQQAIELPAPEELEKHFNPQGFIDVGSIGGPIPFKDILCLAFPKQWHQSRTMREEALQPFTYTQDVGRIAELLCQVGQLEVEQDKEGVKLYGYR